MIIDIEFLVALGIILVLGIWILYVTTTKKWLNWRYKPENDKGRIGEEQRLRDRETAKGTQLLSDEGDSQRRWEFQDRDVEITRQDSPRSRNPFRRRK